MTEYKEQTGTLTHQLNSTGMVIKTSGSGEADIIRTIGIMLCGVFIASLIMVILTRFIPIIKYLSESIITLLVGMLVGVIILIIHYFRATI